MIWMAWSGHFLSESCADSFALTSKFSFGKARMCLKKPFSMLDRESMTYIFLGAVVTKYVIKAMHSCNA